MGDTKCCDHIVTHLISPGLYEERYRTFCAGVFGELTECYITDSATFRQKIGSYDEHQRFHVERNGDKIMAYNFISGEIADTVDVRTISAANIPNYHNSTASCLATTPLFGKNTIKCDINYYQASSYKTDEGIFRTEIQYHCGNEYSNAVFYTDSSTFCIFTGVYIPGSNNNIFRMQRNHDGFTFYNVTERNKLDTINVQTYLLPQLKKGKLIPVCK